MSRIWLRLPVVLAAVVSSLAGQQPKPQPKPAVTTAGVFMGRSGKPMANARLVLGEIESEEEWPFARIKLVNSVSAAVVDEKGRFQFKGLTPGRYTIVYHLTGAAMVIPRVISIKGLSGEEKSILPGMRGVEIGKSFQPLAERAWGQTITLLKGHTFWSMGAYMKIWNATVRWQKQGPYMEMRKGVIWQEQFDDKSQIKLEAWSY